MSTMPLQPSECPFCPNGTVINGTCESCQTSVPRSSPYQSRRATGLRLASRKGISGTPLEQSQVNLNRFWEIQQRAIDRVNRENRLADGE